MIVSIAAGSVTDVIMRAAANELQQRLGQPLVIENIGGAAGMLGGKAGRRRRRLQGVRDLPLDDVVQSAVVQQPAVQPRQPGATGAAVLPGRRRIRPSAINVNSIAELKALAQSKPDALNYATLGEGSYPDLFMKWINNQWGTRIVGIPYKGGGPAAQAVAANQVQITRFGVGNFLGLVQGGKVKALAVSRRSARRDAGRADVH